MVVVPAVGLFLGVRRLGRENVGDVVEHEAPALGVAQDAAVAADALGHEDAAHRQAATPCRSGWNCTHSMSIRSAPAYGAMAWPSPVYSQEFDVYIQDLPMPPVASTKARR